MVRHACIHAPPHSSVEHHAGTARRAVGGDEPANGAASGSSAGIDRTASRRRSEPGGDRAETGHQPGGGDQVGAAFSRVGPGWPGRRQGAGAQAEHRPERCASGSSSGQRGRRRTGRAGRCAAWPRQPACPRRPCNGCGAPTTSRPHATRTFKLSNDKHFERKFWDVIGLYLEPAGARAGAVLRREKPVPSPGTHPARLSRHARAQPHADARLQAPRHRHPVRRAVVPRRQDIQPDRHPAYASAMVGVSQTPQSGGAGRRELAPDRRQLRHPQARQGEILDQVAQPAPPQDAWHRPRGSCISPRPPARG